MTTWYIGKPGAPTVHSHVNYCVHDSGWEATEAHAIDTSPLVEAWATNDHLGFEVFCVHNGVVRKYRPDFLIRLASGAMLVLEVKGREREPDPVKRTFMEEWCRAVTAHGGFGQWCHAVSRGGRCGGSWRGVGSSQARIPTILLDGHRLVGDTSEAHPHHSRLHPPMPGLKWKPTPNVRYAPSRYRTLT